ncbi:MAG: hypothetical protein J0I41_24280 [Filimonas sp.]|nr:hypothetical protein [Filimonas sp.]
MFPAVVPIFLAQVGRDRGKRLEPGLWREWGGAPSVQVLRWRDQTLNVLTKTRFHQRLQVLCPVTLPPSEAMEMNDPLQADQVYHAWSDCVRESTRDTARFKLVFRELMNYGFRRNMLGLKGPAMVVLVLVLAAMYASCAGAMGSFNPVYFPVAFTYSCIGLLLVFIVWQAVVSRSWVKTTAFEYAKRLYEATSMLP